MKQVSKDKKVKFKITKLKFKITKPKLRKATEPATEWGIMPNITPHPHNRPGKKKDSYLSKTELIE